MRSISVGARETVPLQFIAAMTSGRCALDKVHLLHNEREHLVVMWQPHNRPRLGRKIQFHWLAVTRHPRSRDMDFVTERLDMTCRDDDARRPRIQAAQNLASHIRALADRNYRRIRRN